MAKRSCLGAEIRPDLDFTLSLEQQEAWRLLWNNRLRDRWAFIPARVKDGITEEDAVWANIQLGAFAMQALKCVFASIASEEYSIRLRNRKKAVGVGWGWGYDGLWLKEAAQVGLQTTWIDVADVATKDATTSLWSQWEEATNAIRLPEPEVIRAELLSTLIDPPEGFHLDDVAVWYMCRTLGCLISETVPTVLEIMGQSLSDTRDLNRQNRIILVNAFDEDNPGHMYSTSYPVGLWMVKQYTERGAGRTVEVETLGTYQYFDQLYRAIAVRAK